MKIKFSLIIIFLFVLGICFTQIYSQNLSLIIKKTDGTNKSIQLSQLKKITFSTTDMLINYQTGTNENIALSFIQILSFSPYTALNSIFDNTGIIAYPIPSHDILILKNIPFGINELSIYSISGAKLLNLSVINNTINVSGLTKGVYLAKMNNQVIKFTKQ